MQNNLFSWEKFHETPVVGIIRNLSLEQVLTIIPVYIKSGFYTVEVTMNTPNVEKIISTIKEKFPEMNVGAGTVCNIADMKKALDAGSQFIVTPIIDEAVIEYCVQNKIPIFPGAYSPTEVYKAWSLGANAVKIFPATQLGTRYIKDILGPLNQIKVLPTGGVNKDNIGSFFNIGCVGVGMGGSLFDTKIIQENNLELLEAHFKTIKQNATTKQ